MSSPRADFAAVALSGGKVLLMGGEISPTADTAAVDLFDPTTNTISAAAAMSTPRNGFTANLLPNGKVLVAGGSSAPNGTALASAELYDPTTDRWSAAASMSQAREHHVSILLSNGRVFVAGGDGGAGFGSGPDPTGNEIYDPATNTWTGAQTFYGDRPHGPAVAQYRDGRVMIYGGVDHEIPGNQVEYYDPSTGQMLNGPIVNITDYSTAAVLGNGNVLIVGGQSNYQPSGAVNTTTMVSTAGDCGGQVGCPNSAWSTGPAMSVGHDHHTMTTLHNGRVLVVGGRYGTSEPIAVAEIFEPNAQKWWPAGTTQNSRAYHVAVLLPDGRVFVAGGFAAGGAPTATSEIYTPA